MLKFLIKKRGLSKICTPYPPFLLPSWLAGRGHWPGVPGRPRPHRQKFQRSYKCGGGDASCTFPHFCGQLLVESMQSLNLVFCPFLWSAVGRVYAVPRILEQPLSFIAYLGNELRNDWSSRVYLTPDWLRGDGVAPRAIYVRLNSPDL